MSSLPKKEDSGGSRRRSALTSAFEELALEADKKTDEGEEFSAYVQVDRSRLNSTPTVVTSIGDGNSVDHSELRGPSFGRHAQNGGWDSPSSHAMESESLGRQHGSFNALSFLTGDFDSHGGRDSPVKGMDIRGGVQTLSGTPFEFTNGESEFTDATPNEMSYLFSTFEDEDSSGKESADETNEVSDAQSSCKKLSLNVQNPLFGSAGNPANILPRVVVVHGVDGDEDDLCTESAGRKQRGSFSSLLLLEAHELSTVDSSPTHFKLMQAHLEEERIGVGQSGGMASMPVSAFS